MAYGLSIYNPAWGKSLAKITELYENAGRDPVTTDYEVYVQTNLGDSARLHSDDVLGGAGGLVELRDDFVDLINSSNIGLYADALAQQLSIQYDSFESSYLAIQAQPNSGITSFTVGFNAGIATQTVNSYDATEVRQNLDENVIRVVDYGETNDSSGSVSIPDFDTTYGSFLFAAADALLGAAETFPHVTWNNTTKVLSWSQGQLYEKFGTGSPTTYPQFENKLAWYAIAEPGHPSQNAEDYKFIVNDRNGNLMIDASYQNIANVSNTIEVNWRTAGIWDDFSATSRASTAYDKPYPSIRTTGSFDENRVYADNIRHVTFDVDSDVDGLISIVSPTTVNSHVLGTGTEAGGNITYRTAFVNPGSATNTLKHTTLGLIVNADPGTYGLLIKNRAGNVCFTDNYTYPKIITNETIVNIEDISFPSGYTDISHDAVTDPYYSVVFTHNPYKFIKDGDYREAWRLGIRKVNSTTSRLEWNLFVRHKANPGDAGDEIYTYQEGAECYVTIFDLEGIEPHHIVGDRF